MNMKRICGLVCSLIAAVLLAACGGGGGGSVSISATATTTAQSLTVGTAMTSFSPIAPSGGATPYKYSYGGTLPVGLSLNAGTGAVTGTPTATYATANVVFSVQDANGVVANTTSTVSFTVGAASATLTAIANTTAQSLTVGTAMVSYSPLTPSGGAAPYTYNITSGTLPAGLSLDASTGAVTGTPRATYAAANVVFSVKDANNVVASATSSVSFTVVAAPVAINATATTTTQNLTVGTAMASFSPLTPSGGVSPYKYSVTAGTLPAGLSLDASTGTVTGIPTATYTAANVVFAVQDANGVVASTTSTVIFTAVVVFAPLTATATANTTAQNLAVGSAMTSFLPLTPSGGTVPYTYSNLGALPAGLSLNTSTGTVTGTPTAANAGVDVYFLVKDGSNVMASTTSAVHFTVVPAITATAKTTAQKLAVGNAMVSFSPLTPSDGITPYTYSVKSGTLPAGLILNASTGAVSGTPTATYTAADVVFSVKDANSAVASATSTVNFLVDPALTAVVDTTAQNLTVGTAITSFTPVTPSGGVAPYTYSVTSGTLPAGLTLDANTGAVTGKPSVAYTTANVVFSALDANGVVANPTSTVSFTVAELPAGYLYRGGLVWTPLTTTTYTRAGAIAYCAGTTINGQTGWRLPTDADSLGGGLTTALLISWGWPSSVTMWKNGATVGLLAYASDWVPWNGGPTVVISPSLVPDTTLYPIICVR